MIADVSECTAIFSQTCEMFMFLHKKGYLHNDLKVIVILAGASHKVMLIDW